MPPDATVDLTTYEDVFMRQTSLSGEVFNLENANACSIKAGSGDVGNNKTMNELLEYTGFRSLKEMANQNAYSTILQFQKFKPELFTMRSTRQRSMRNQKDLKTASALRKNVKSFYLKKLLTMGTILIVVLVLVLVNINKAYTPLLCRLTVNGRPPSRFFKVAPISVFNIFLAQGFGHLDIFLRFWTLPRGFGAGLSGKTSRMVFSRSGLKSCSLKII